MISPLRATGIIASGTAIYLIVGVAVGKALALFVGPAGVGIWGLMQSFTGIVGIASGLGVAVSLVRHTAAAVGQGKVESTRALRAGALITSITAAVIVLGVAVLLSSWIARQFLGDPMLASAVPLLALAVGLTLLGSAEQAALNGWHLLRPLTEVVVGSSIVGGAATIGFVATFGMAGIAPGLLATAAAGAIFGAIATSRHLGMPDLSPIRSALRAAAQLVRGGVPFALSQGVGTGAQLLVPVVILSLLDAASVGYYRASIMISVGYLAFLLNGLAQDYYPRVAAAPADELRELVERRTRLVLALGVPLILMTLALAPVVVAVLYSGEFSPAVDVLRWQLIGDLLKLPAWAMAFAILARGKTGTFFAVELAGGASLLGAISVSVAWLGLPGAGVGYLVSYAIYYVAAWIGIRRVAPVVPGRLQMLVLSLSGGLVLTELVLAEWPLAISLVTGSVAVAMAAIAWPRLWKLHRIGQL